MSVSARSTGRWRRRLAVLTVGGLLVAACGGDDDTTEDATTEDDGGEEPADTEEGGDDGGDTGDGSEEPTDGGAEPPDEDTSDGSPIVETLPPEENAEPVSGGTLRFGLEAESDGLNPVTSSFAVSGAQMGGAVFDTLAASTTDGGWTPYLAESFTPSDDYLSWTMKLRDGILFHDGTPLNADAVIENFETVKSDPLVGLAVAPFFPAEGSSEKIDDLTVKFNLLDPNAHFPAQLTGQFGMISSPTWLAAARDDPTLNQEPVGTGPFVFASRLEDSVTRFERNDNWWNGDVYLDAVEFFPVSNVDDRVDLLLNGELDGLHTTNQASILDLQAADNIRNILDDTGEESFAMINSSRPPFDDIRAREALAQATPIGLYNDLIGLGVTRQASQAYIPENPYHNPDVLPVGDNPDRAVELAAEYCAERGTEDNAITGTPTCTDGKINMEFQWSGDGVVDLRIADLLEEGWSPAFNVTPDNVAQDEHIQQTALGQYNVNTWRQFGAEDPSVDKTWVLCRTIGFLSINWPRSCDEDRDALLLEAQATPDEARRVELYQQATQLIADQYLYVFFNHTLWDLAFEDSVRGVCDRTSPEGVPLACSTNGRAWFDKTWIEG